MLDCTRTDGVHPRLVAKISKNPTKSQISRHPVVVGDQSLRDFRAGWSVISSMLMAMPLRIVPRLWSHRSGANPVRNITASANEAAVTSGVAARPVERAADGTAEASGVDPQELHDLVVEHGDAIYRLALSVVRDPSLAEDVAQETLVKAWLALPTFRGDASLKSWVLRIAHNTAISTLRTRRAVVIDPYDMPEPTQHADRSVEARVQSDAVMDEFAQALSMLDELSRSIVVLRELEGLAYDEIADVLNVPMPTVKTRLLRARRRLGTVLREWA